MKKGTSAIHGATFFFYNKGHGAAPFYFSLDKTLGQLEPNLAGMFLGWSSTNFRFFVPI
jgi:hypothetical protein